MLKKHLKFSKSTMDLVGITPQRGLVNDTNIKLYKLEAYKLS